MFQDDLKDKLGGSILTPIVLPKFVIKWLDNTYNNYDHIFALLYTFGNISGKAGISSFPIYHLCGSAEINKYMHI